MREGPAVCTSTEFCVASFAAADQYRRPGLRDLQRGCRFTGPAVRHSSAVFNVCVGNTDDHLPNHAAFWDDVRLALTPASDVLAAAVAAGADSIITCDLRDFPLAACEPHGVVAEHPDSVLLDLWAREPRILLRVLGEQTASTGRRGTRLTIHQILDYLASAGARRFAATARRSVPPLDNVPALP